MTVMIANLQTELVVVKTGTAAIPMTINKASDPATCYICCPSVAYVDYAREELRNFARSPLARRALSWLLDIAGPLMRGTGFDNQVQPNNWLLSTNIWCGANPDDILRMTGDLLARFPESAIVWRSLNDRSDIAAIESFRATGYRLYPARQIYLYDCRATLPPLRRDLKNDIKLTGVPGYDICGPGDIRPSDFERIADLYKMLYLEKYTSLNPHYTARFMARMHECGFIEFHGLRTGAGELAGVIGFFSQGNVMTAPVVGYDTTLPQADGLYRRLVAIGMLEARARRQLYNMSAGAAMFKRTRGGEPAIEYIAIYNSHLPLKRRVAGWVVRKILSRIGVPIMRKYQL
jgi:hypothetical protein